MTSLKVFLLAIVTVTYGKPANVDPKLPEKLIIGGDDANYDTTRHQIMLQLFYSNEWHFTCGGCIIAKTTVLTAHHCCDFPGFTTQHFRIFVNEYNLNDSSGSIVNIKTIKKNIEQRLYDVLDTDYFSITPNENGQFHPLYRKKCIKFARKHSETRFRIYHQDVCVMQTTEELPSSYIIPLPKKNEDFTGQNCTATGWGDIEISGSKVFSTVLQQVWGTIMPIEDCLNLYLNREKIPKAFLTDKSICFAGGADSTVGICQGDSGGPLVCNGVLAGVTSWTSVGCYPQYPSVFMSVSKHLGWITAQMKKFDKQQ